MFFRCFRAFKAPSSPFKHTGHFTRELDYLGNPSNYTPPNIPTLIKSLQSCINPKDKTSPQNDWKSEKLFKSLPNFSNIITSLSPEQSISLFKTLGILHCPIEDLWNKLEKHITRKVFRELSPHQIAIMIDSATKGNRSSDALWNTLESTIINRIYPKQSFTAEEITTVLTGFSQMTKGGEELLLGTRKNLLEVMENLNMKDYIKILQLYTKQRDLDSELIEALCNRSTAFLEVLEGSKLQIVFLGIMKTEIDKKYSKALRKVVISKVPTFNLASISAIVYHYSQFNFFYTKGPDELLETIEKFFHQNRSRLITENVFPDTEGMILKIMWGLSQAECMNILKIWKEFGVEVYKDKNYMKSPFWPLHNQIIAALRSRALF